MLASSLHSALVLSSMEGSAVLEQREDESNLFGGFMMLDSDAFSFSCVLDVFYGVCYAEEHAAACLRSEAVPRKPLLNLSPCSPPNCQLKV